jgi:assimilatory nitrate reductase catalytic subunit
MATNPAASLPRAGAVRAALRNLELFVVSDHVLGNDTIACSPHVLLPAAAWGEKDGTVTNSERRISRQRAFLPPPGEARPDWRIVSDTAKRMGFGASFAYRSAADVFREHAALSGFENGGTRAFDIAALASISDRDYEALEPVQWPIRADGDATRLFRDGNFFTGDRKARFVAIERPALAQRTDATFPLRLNTGRIRDQWHSMTRSGRSPTLASHRPEPFVEVHPADADRWGLIHDGFAELRSAHGSCILKVVVSPGQQRGSIFAPIHWSGPTASSARVGDLVAAMVDPLSGQPEAKATPVAVAPVSFAWRGFALSRRPLAFPIGTWWARIATPGASGCTFASNENLTMWHDLSPELFPDAVLTEYIDRQRGIYRVAAFLDERLEGALFVGPAATPPQWSELRTIAGEARVLDGGPVVCACFGVGIDAIRDALVSRRAASAEEVGIALRAGTKCGTCLSELRSIVVNESHVG